MSLQPNAGNWFTDIASSIGTIARDTISTVAQLEANEWLVKQNKTGTPMVMDPMSGVFRIAVPQSPFASGAAGAPAASDAGQLTYNTGMSQTDMILIGGALGLAAILVLK